MRARPPAGRGKSRPRPFSTCCWRTAACFFDSAPDRPAL